MTARGKVLVLALAFALTGCSGGSGDAAGPNVDPPMDDPVTPNDPGTPPQNQGVQGSYVLEQINDSHPGQLVTIANADGQVIGLYRFDAATRLELHADQAFALTLLYSNDIKKLVLEDRGELEQAGPASQDGAVPLTFTSATYGDQFTGVVVGDIVAIKYDFDGDGELDTSFGFRRAD